MASRKIVRGAGSFGGTLVDTDSSIGAFPLCFRFAGACVLGAATSAKSSEIYTSSWAVKVTIPLLMPWLVGVFAAPGGGGERIASQCASASIGFFRFAAISRTILFVFHSA